jgi:glycosyltransferase involved in cell wall biosynthesis
MTSNDRSTGPLRIVLVGPAWPYRGGISHYNTCLARELARSHDMTVVNYSRLYPDFLFPGRTQYDESETALRIESRRLIDSINPFTWLRAGFAIARLRPDAVVVQWWHPYFAPALSKICFIVRVLTRARIVFVCHNVVPHETSPADRCLSAIAFAGAHGFIVQSGEDLSNLRRFRRGAPAAVHPHPIYDFFRTGEMTREAARSAIGEGGGPLLLFFGYIRPYKGLMHLIEAMPEISRATGARLLVVGEFYEEEAPYLKRVAELGMEGAVRFVDRYVGNEEVAGFFTAADLVVLPYLSATQSGIAQIAVAFDRPMVATRVGGLPEVVVEGRTGFIVEPGDPAALAAAVRRFFEEGWAVRMAPEFAAEKERFSWAGMVRELEGLLRRID